MLAIYNENYVNFFRLTMSSQPIVVPGGDNHRPQVETHSISVGSSVDTFKTMTPPNVSRSLSRKYIILLHIVLIFY
jgi:hypothetical protein